MDSDAFGGNSSSHDGELVRAVQEVLTTKKKIQDHPGGGKLTQIYPNADDVTSVLAETITNRGQYRVASNNLSLGAQSTFSISTSAILDNLILVFSVKAPDNAFFSHRGWGFDLIRSMEWTYSNSLMQSMVLRGPILKEYSKLCCGTKFDREQMLNHAGPLPTAPGQTLKAAVPLSFLNFDTSGQRGSWPLDASVLAGSITVSVNWVSQAESSAIFVNSDTDYSTDNLPTAVIGAGITSTTMNIQRAPFTVKHSMQANPSLTYTLPARYINVVDKSKSSLTSVTESITINLDSAPAGQLEGILLYAAPNGGGDDFVTGDGALRKHSGGLKIGELGLQFGGQDLLRFRSHEELLAFNRAAFADSLEYDDLIILPGADASSFGYTKANSVVQIIPLCQNAIGVFNEKIHEHLPSYGGSQLQLEVTFLDDSDEITPTAGSAYGPANGDPIEATSIKIWVAFLIDATLMIKNGVVDLQL